MNCYEAMKSRGYTDAEITLAYEEMIAESMDGE